MKDSQIVLGICVLIAVIVIVSVVVSGMIVTKEYGTAFEKRVELLEQKVSEQQAEIDLFKKR